MLLARCVSPALAARFVPDERPGRCSHRVRQFDLATRHGFPGKPSQERARHPARAARPLGQACTCTAIACAEALKGSSARRNISAPPAQCVRPVLAVRSGLHPLL